MANEIDNIAAAIIDIGQAMTGITLKSAPDYPVENAEPLPFMVAFADKGEFFAVNVSMVKNFPVIGAHFFLSRVNIKQMQRQINAIAYEFPRRIAGNPTLNGTVQTVVMTSDLRILYNSEDAEWAGVKVRHIWFDLPVKLFATPITA